MGTNGIGYVNSVLAALPGRMDESMILLDT